MSPGADVRIKPRCLAFLSTESRTKNNVKYMSMVFAFLLGFTDRYRLKKCEKSAIADIMHRNQSESDPSESQCPDRDGK